ncbi:MULTISPECIES: transposase family protein [unclassified Arthrobacter]|uniref:integrase catalytic domain-containing protein n=1 Tax=unclassified Arthrobacter TaxID=235627 RepID=UPI002157792D|nr:MULTISPECIES: transposase family protein [unclassified Arthrobacter]
MEVIAGSEEKMRKRDLVSTQGSPDNGTFEVQHDEGTPMGGGESAPPPLAVGVAFWAPTHVTEYTQATKIRVDDARIELEPGSATSVTPRSMPSVPHETMARETTGYCGGMGNESSTATRAEVTHKYAKAYAAASKKDRGRMLDEVVSVTGWSRDNARRRLVAASKTPPGPGRAVATPVRKPRAPKFSYDARMVLQKVWAASGGQCGKYLAVSMRAHLDALERHGELTHGSDRYSRAVRTELLAMSAASIDRYLASAKAKDAIGGNSTTKPSPPLRSSIATRRAWDEVEDEPGFFECEIIAHRGPTLTGEFARTVNLTDVHTGWVFTHTIRNNAHTTHILASLQAAVDAIPCAVTGLDFDNGGEFLNHALIDWAAERLIYIARSRPYKKKDQATAESKKNHLVRKYAFDYRYDTPEERAVLARLWPLVNDRLNYLTPTKKPIGYGSDRNGRRTRLYDPPRTPFDRLLTARVMAPAQEAELTAYRDTLNPAELARRIDDLQDRLARLAKNKTEQLYLADSPSRLPDVHRGILIPAS